jgi:XTP/dITP diphosphohydrolase
MPTIVLATQNPGKVAELRDLLVDSGIDIIGLADHDQQFQEPKEDGTTFLENATIKAKTYAELTGMVCLADDSGLEIDALDGRPGVISSHYAFDGDEDGPAKDMNRQQRDLLNCDRVLTELEKIAPEERTARFLCTMVLADHQSQVLATSVGSFEGRIGTSDQVPRGDNGFGYDPLFLVGPDYERTSAELSPDEKNACSHRAKAVGEMIGKIRSVFNNI